MTVLMKDSKKVRVCGARIRIEWAPEQGRCSLIVIFSEYESIFSSDVVRNLSTLRVLRVPNKDRIEARTGMRKLDHDFHLT